MITVRLTDHEVNSEIDRIFRFIQDKVPSDSKAIIGVSGGVDSDLATRLCYQSLGKDRVKCFIVLQEDMDESHLRNARSLCNELSVPLTEFPLRHFPKEILNALGERDNIFHTDSMDDLVRIKLSLRTVVFSMYNEYGFIVVSNSNRTELETGLYMSFGDALGHIKPLVHLYKTQIRQLAERIGTGRNVLEQEPSSGLRRGANDLSDIAHWMQKGEPNIGNVYYSPSENEQAHRIFEQLTFERLDKALLGLRLQLDPDSITQESELPRELIDKLRSLVRSANAFKGRPLGVSLIES